MNIIISHVYSADNKGDAALLGVLIDEVKQQFPGADITILSMDNVGPDEYFDGVKVRHSFMYYVNQWSRNKIAWLCYGVSLMVYTLLWATIYRILHIKLPMFENWKRIAMLYAESDLIIAVGGGYLRTKASVGSMFDFCLLLHPIALAKRLGKPTVLYTQSVGPLHRSIERRMLTHTIEHNSALAIIREDKSMQLLKSIGVTNCVRSVDAGFLLKTDAASTQRLNLSLPNDKLIVGVTARRWLDPASQQAYEEAFARTLDYVVKNHNAFVVFIPQVTSEFHGDDDRKISDAVYAAMEQKQSAVALQENYDYRQIKAIYDQLDVLLGTRFHSVIFSLTSFVPALAIEYEHKTSGIMHDLGLDEWVVKMEDVSADKLQPLMDKLITEQENYRQKLHRILPAYIDQAHQAIELTAEAYQKAGKKY